MKRYGVLVVDDSAFMRKAISEIIESDSELFVVGIARNGEDALEKIKRLKPCLVTMDLDMPVIDGLSALELIMAETPLPVVMLSQFTNESTTATIKSLELGAVDFILKDDLFVEGNSGMKDQFLEVIKASIQAAFHKEQRVKVEEVEEKETDKEIIVESDLIIIGCSTGGPSALQEILPKFPADFPVPVFVVQHMPPGFTKPLADRFNEMCNLNVKEASHGEVMEKGTIYIATAGYQTTIIEHGDGRKTFNVGPYSGEYLYKPSVDVTLQSAAPIFKEKLITAILTGMGTDGVEGTRYVKMNNGTVFVEAEETCVVYGMPKAVYEAGLADKKVSLPNMYHYLTK
ncbi:chemotaxis response regulator protein-glutamate methylesterase [Bacillus sp. BGMRC 2118]|nr:chemotaxis response regulator protein-glutamate methylesterase [Bacillus sp. BGMRC 2118]